MIDAVLDLLAGSSCTGCRRPGRQLCGSCLRTLAVSSVRVRPTPCPPGLARVHATGEYAGLLRALVLGHKEHHRLVLARPLGALLATSVAGVLAEGRAPEGPVVLVPVPSRPGSARRRGHEPTWDITRAAAGFLRRAGIDASACRLLRVERVRDQRGLGAGERAANLAGAMHVDTARQARLARRVRGPVAVVLCDDVLTTGSTAREAQRALAATGVAITGVAVVAATRRRAMGTRARAHSESSARVLSSGGIWG